MTSSMATTTAVTDGARVVFGEVAFAKVIVHCMKYSNRPICGVLLGEESKEMRVKNNNRRGDDDDDDAAAAAAAVTVRVVDVIPLFHNHQSALPYEIALPQIDAYALSQKLRVVGCYFANERVDDDQIGVQMNSLGSKIIRQYASACMVMVDNESILAAYQSPLRVFTCVDGRTWRQQQQGRESTVEEVVSGGHDTLVAVNEMVKRGGGGGGGGGVALVDFEEYLVDVSRDWTNPDFAITG